MQSRVHIFSRHLGHAIGQEQDHGLLLKLRVLLKELDTAAFFLEFDEALNQSFLSLS
jgi:hypothetical protein